MLSCGFVCFAGESVRMVDLENFFLKSVNVCSVSFKIHDFEAWKIAQRSQVRVQLRGIFNFLPANAKR